jgi:hypothetical protein
VEEQVESEVQATGVPPTAVMQRAMLSPLVMEQVE